MAVDEINPSSVWYKYTYQRRAFYQDRTTQPWVYSRVQPAGHVVDPGSMSSAERCVT